jgi:hypothetical protein
MTIRAVILATVCALGVAGHAAAAGRGAATQQIRVPVSATELRWRTRVSFMAAGNPLVQPSALKRSSRALRRTVAAAGAKPVRLIIRRAMEPAPELVVTAAAPAHYLKHGLAPLLRRMRNDRNIYLEVVDGNGRRILEWAVNGDKTPNSGSLFVRHGLEACSPIQALGWPSRLPACPSH